MADPWPTGDDLRSWMQKRGEVNLDPAQKDLQDEVVDDVAVFVSDLTGQAIDVAPARPVSRATIIEAYSVYHRRLAPEAVAGSGDHAIRWGRFDPTAAALLGPYIKPRIGAMEP